MAAIIIQPAVQTAADLNFIVFNIKGLIKCIYITANITLVIMLCNPLLRILFHNFKIKILFFFILKLMSYISFLKK